MLTSCDDDINQLLNTDIDVSGVGKRFEYLKHILEHFWNRW